MIPRSTVALVCACLLSACGVSGPAEGVKPQPVDMHTDLGKIGPDNGNALGAPAGWTPAPTITTPVFKAAAPALFAAMQEILLAQPRTWLTAAYPEAMQAFFIVRSLTLNFPDIVVIQAIADSPETSKAVIFSQSRYNGIPFLGDNQKRVQRLVGVLTNRFGIVVPPATP